MALTRLDVRGYRSLRNIQLPLQNLNIVTGANGAGKSNLYRSLWLIARVAEGNFARSICSEGGLLSAMWAGPRTNAKKPLRMSLGFRTEDMAFDLSCGFPIPSATAFMYDPQIKEEAVWFGPRRLPTTTLLERKNARTSIRDVEGNRIDYPLMLDQNESVLSQLREPNQFPELFNIRSEILSWRFYHTFRTDSESPLRMPKVSVRTPVLSHDGSDLAAALQTILEIGDSHTLHSTISNALPGRTLRIDSSEAGPTAKSPQCTELSVSLETEGCSRPLVARELSDGTLKFLCLVAALLTPRPPSLIALNEPEASLHPDLLKPLARLIVEAANFSQIWVTTHSTTLASEIARAGNISPIDLQLINGETVVNEG